MSKAVRAKFKCHSIEQYEHSSKVKMGAVYSTTGENKDFSDATPAGEFWMVISKDRPAASFFEVGKEYYIDVSEAVQVLG
ncbi:MAG: hypothetical protein ACSHWN_04840 [Methylophilaceae bacterium]